ncbi:MAG: ABC transporter ATP-binding protein [Dorea sp.]|jgi:putative ABC transport system ATP-binding protein|nr:ABC transporter ATP-binding protein [Dorea sp.]
MGALIEIKDMYKIYHPGENEVYALNGVSLTVEKGEFTAIIGHSGSGKSTLMNMIGCLDVPTEGSYRLNGRDVSQMTDNELSDIRNQEIGFIFQGFNLIANLDALANVELPLIYRGLDRKMRRKIAVSSLEIVGLEERVHHKPSQMSGGQQQRVAIARAIAARPPVILADEPTGNLDSRATWEILDILKELHKEGRTVIIITHDPEIAKQAERVIRIKDGKIIEDYQNKVLKESGPGQKSREEQDTSTIQEVTGDV